MSTNMIVGVVEDNSDPMGAGRVRVRTFEYHTQDTAMLPTADLPWCQCIYPVTIAGTMEASAASVGLLLGSWVVGFFRDSPDNQDFVVMGSFAGGLNAYGGAGGGGMGAGAWGGGGMGAMPGPGGYGPMGAPKPGAPVGTGHTAVGLSMVNRVYETSKNQGPGIAQIWQTIGMPNGYAQRLPWCCAFASSVIIKSGVLPPAACPRTALCTDMIVWGQRSAHARVTHSPRSVSAGDVCVFKTGIGHHVLIATSNSNAQGSFTSVEGNTNPQGRRGPNGVYTKTRRVASLKAAITLISQRRA